MYGYHVRGGVTDLARGLCAFQGTRLATNAWLARWSHNQQQTGGASRGRGGLGSFAGVYLVLGAAYAVATFCRSATNNLGWVGRFS